ncbi:hypothetical protein [Jiulongibacter sediminis]|uniref:hypothetical protein n=1 Tax=Jiulongibacter sediminis TaxID=1605367 RepID=UPI0026EA4531|nr:hypothetical protein [Jiulongibacter sediminis]
MRKLLSILSVLCLTMTFAMATEPQPEAFTLNEKEIAAEFDQLNKIEKYVQESDVTLEELQAENSDLVSGIELSANSSNVLSAVEAPLGIPAFWWGCVLSGVGLLLVYILSDQNKADTKQALIGCLVNAGVIILLNVGLRAFFW